MRKLLIIFIILIILIAGAFFWYQTSIQPVNPADKSTRIFIVHQGDSVRTLANALQKAGLIRNDVAFFIIVKQKGLEGKIQAGDFRLSPSEYAEKIAEDLTHGALDVWITVPEGKRAEEIAEILQSKFSQYNDTWKTALLPHEGYLFPDTYLIPQNMPNVAVLQTRMLDNFASKYQRAASSPTTSLPKDQLVIVASLVEREAKFPEDRPLIASVIMNRLKINMALQIDATVQYALGYQRQEKTWWKKNLTAEDIKYPSPYNTYLNTGLPPAPICNPGASALQAAAHPGDTQYLYYIADKSGHSHFAKTLEEHNANIKNYGL